MRPLTDSVTHHSLLYSDTTSFASVICIGLKILTVPSFSVTLIVFIFVFYLSEFSFLIKKLGEPEKIVLQVITICVEDTFTPVINKGTRHTESAVFGCKIIKYSIEKFSIVHIFMIFIS